jgi:hypothetical protein
LIADLSGVFITILMKEPISLYPTLEVDLTTSIYYIILFMNRLTLSELFVVKKYHIDKAGTTYNTEIKLKKYSTKKLEYRLN